MKSAIRVRSLILDDDEAVCRKLTGWIESETLEVYAHRHAHEAVGAALEVQPHLALVDLRMPDADGCDVMATLRRALPRLRLVAMCAFPQPIDVQRAYDAGAQSLLQKPIERKALDDTMRHELAQICADRRTEREFNDWLGAQLRAARLATDLTQTHVAREVGITPAQLSQIELGKTGTAAWTLARICNALKISLPTLWRAPTDTTGFSPGVTHVPVQPPRRFVDAP